MKNPLSDYSKEQRAWVVFTNQTELSFLKLFKRGFRHCFVLIHDGEHWISVDPMAHYMEVSIQNVPCDFDLPIWLERRGHTVIDAKLSQEMRTSAPFMIFTCVEACKRILGIHKISILTPWQLYKYLKQTSHQEYKNGKSKLFGQSANPATAGGLCTRAVINNNG